MANFTVRVVLHDATIAQHRTLDEQMSASLDGHRAIQGDNGIVYELPNGEYDIVRDASVEQVLQTAVAIATKIKALPLPSVLVTESKSRAWSLRPVPSRSETWFDFHPARKMET